jgi:hypothetical protein
MTFFGVFASAVDALVLIAPPQIWRTARQVVVAWGFIVQIRVLRQLHHNGTHHFVVLVPQDVAVVDISGELPQLVIGNVEVGTVLCILRREFGFGPSDAIVQGFERLHEGVILPTGIVELTRGMAAILDVCVDFTEVAALFKGILQDAITLEKALKCQLVQLGQ